MGKIVYMCVYRVCVCVRFETLCSCVNVMAGLVMA